MLFEDDTYHPSSMDAIIDNTILPNIAKEIYWILCIGAKYKSHKHLFYDKIF